MKRRRSNRLGEQAVSITMPCRAYCLGIVEYISSCRLLERLAKRRAADEIPDMILLLEHLPVFTTGRRGYKPEHIRVSSVILDREGIPIHRSNRGGGITYHGPGQLVCYPVFDLRSMGLNIRQYIAALEEVVIVALARFNIPARPAPTTGIVVDEQEICAIGIHLSRDVTTHGFALNVNTDLDYFSHIAPCGVIGKHVTSVARLLGHQVPLPAFVEPLIDAFGSVFNLEVRLESPEQLEEYGEN